MKLSVLYWVIEQRNYSLNQSLMFIRHLCHLKSSIGYVTSSFIFQLQSQRKRMIQKISI